MSRHKNVRLSLYDYLDGTLPDQERASVEEHVRSCRACTEDLRRMKEARSLVSRPERPASDARSEEFWATFYAAVEGKIQEHHARKSRLADIWDTIQSVLFFRRGAFALAGMAVAVIVLILVLVNRPAPTHEYVFVDSSRSKAVPLEPHNETAQQADDQKTAPSDEVTRSEYSAQPLEAPLRVSYADNRMSQYLRKSKVLLIGIANLKTGEGQPMDLSVEQRTSRELIREARYLKQRPLEPRVDQLVDAMSRILIELANISKEKQIPNMEIVRSGIHQENLLFKIRMAETVFDSAHVVYAKGTIQ
jgi:anti-sigma factor RsiW